MAYCDYCQRHVATERCWEPNHVLWAVITLFTCGFCLPIWILDILIGEFMGFRCVFCGEKLKR